MTRHADSAEPTSQPCPYCDRQESTPELLALHVGEAHWDSATHGERDRYREAYEHESEQLWRFRLVSVGVLVALYFGFLFVYAVVG